MQRERPLIRPPLLAAFPVHPDAGELRRAVVAVALVGPPTVDAEVIERLVCGPVTADLMFRRPLSVWRSAGRNVWCGAWISECARELSTLSDDVQHDFEVLGVQLVD